MSWLPGVWHGVPAPHVMRAPCVSVWPLSWLCLGTWHQWSPSLRHSVPLSRTCHGSHAPPLPGRWALCSPSAPRDQPPMWGQHPPGHCALLSCLLTLWSLVTVSLLRTTLGWTLINIPSASAVGASHQPLMPASHWSSEAPISLLIGWLCEAVCERLTRPQCRQRTTGPSPVPASVPAVASTSQTQNRIMPEPEPGTRYYWHLRENLPAYLIIDNYSQYLADRSYYSFPVTEVLPGEPGGWWQGLGAVSAVCTPGHSLPDFCHKITGNERANTRHWPASESVSPVYNGIINLAVSIADDA